MSAPKEYIAADAGEVISFMGMDLVWKIVNEPEGELLTFIQVAPPGGGVPLHIHHNEDEYIYVLEGSLRFQLGDEAFDVGEGDHVYMPRGKIHGFRITGDKTARILFTLAMKPESRYVEMFEGLVGLAPEDFDKVVEVCGRNQVEFLTPPQLPE
ncbi:cupin domain-containing protein [Salipiger abyssi]|uniref:cupin domain-containing protein n=1 Tax=Salipiger abyssi TaxID=1250539 RepID=UPI001A8F3A99|nr:cupin domain-containing protein [Salipiger abyssi]MBN9888131.1 cupin domain-containing protein [Salipiger abyssi]